VALARQDLAAAATAADRVDDPFWAPLSHARIHLAAGRSAQAAEAAELAVPRCTRHLVVRDLVLARAVVDRDKDAAAKSVAQAADLAADHGLLRSVAAEGPAVLELAELAAWRVPDAWLARLRRAVVSGPAPTTAATRLVEPLTERERDVLRLLPSRLTLREIAGELFVSQNTLKFHLRVIYRKLGANSRAEAVASARALRLLAHG
jgi:LuxR family maltose regulon positive regulatory protein